MFIHASIYLTISEPYKNINTFNLYIYLRTLDRLYFIYKTTVNYVFAHPCGSHIVYFEISQRMYDHPQNKQNLSRFFLPTVHVYRLITILPITS
jgi:hypothetical protein